MNVDAKTIHVIYNVERPMKIRTNHSEKNDIIHREIFKFMHSNRELIHFPGCVAFVDNSLKHIEKRYLPYVDVYKEDDSFWLAKRKRRYG